MSDHPAPRPMRRLAWVAAIATLALVEMGFVVTFTNSGQGCGGSWPLCGGRFIPEIAFHPLIEFSHRALAAIIAVLVVWLAVWVWRRRQVPLERYLAAVAVLFILVQAAIGAADVIAPESAPVLALHFGFALIALGATTLLAVALSQSRIPATPLPPALRYLSAVTFVYLYLAVYLGAFVAHQDAGLACLTWPLCTVHVAAALRPAVQLDEFHRLVAVGLTVLLGLIFWQARRQRTERPDVVQAAHVAIGVVALQILSGVLLVLSHIATWAVLIHVGLVSVLFVAVGYLLVASLGGLGEQTSADAGAEAGPSAGN